MKFPLVQVPDFKKEVEDESKPGFYSNLSEHDKDEYDRNLVMQRSILWACRTSAAAYNLCIVIAMFLFIVNGSKIAVLLQKFIHNQLGTQP